MTKVFVSWSGAFGKKIAEYLHSDLLKYANLKPWVSSHDITAGSAWFNETSDALNESEYGVVCLTPGTSKMPWINFEIGWLYGKLNNCKIISFDEEIDNPLSNLQRLDGKEEDTWFQLLRDMIPRNERQDDEIRDRVNSKFPKLQTIFKLVNKQPYAFYNEFDVIFSNFHDVIKELKKNPYAQNNILFHKILSKSYTDLILNSRNLESDFSVPASEYPKFLIHLLGSISPTPIVKAIALVDIEEDFWRFPTGTRIKDFSHTESIRIFVFTKKEDLQSYFPILKLHALKYDVYAVSYQRLSEIIGDKATDFSIILLGDVSLLAKYDDDTDLQNEIKFISDPSQISSYEDNFDSLMRSNFVVKIDRNFDYSEEDIRYFCRKVFYGLTLYPRKPVEMSLYINVFDYDENEYNHAYYSDMTDRMLEICQKNISEHEVQGPLEVLKLGAGTGIFTMLLANRLVKKLSKIDAIEFDWHCYKILNIKTRQFSSTHPNISVNVHHEDSRTYDPKGKFNYIFSAFADHHIKKADKDIYFENVKNNLKPGGLMIVGDEFLREHNQDDRIDREGALHDYHNHIINIAKEQNNDILAELENQALISGLEEKGDFKVSCSQYENCVKDAGFSIVEKTKIGPTDDSLKEIGGIYIYVMKLEDQGEGSTTYRQ